MGIVLVVLGGLMAFLATDHLSWAIMMILTGLAGWVAGRVWPRNEPASRTLRALGLIALAGVILQGVLGGLRVTLLQDAIGIVHAALAQMFFALIAVICLLNSGGWRRLSAAGDFTGPTRAFAWLVGLTTVLVFAQLMIGAGMRHQHAGLAVPDFPLAYGEFWPETDEASIQSYNRQRIEVVWANPITAGQVRLHMVHRLVAFGILAAVVVVAARSWRYGRGHPARRWGVLWLGLILGQGVLGAATVWSNKAADVATGHVVVGALCLVTGVLFTRVCFHLRGQERIARISSVTAAGPSDNFPPVSSAVPEAR
jgi:cytochrome c oxidase assembly protein subunit 15